MQTVINIKNVEKLIKKLKAERKKIVLTGGCFDLLHIGHIRLLENAKKQGDILIVMIEHDKRITELKGPSRPIFSQAQRAEVVSNIKAVDYVIRLPYLTKNEEYDRLVSRISPDTIAVTKGDKVIQYVKKQAKIIHAKVMAVTAKIPAVSSTNIVKALEELI